MEGYGRTPQKTAELVAALTTALYAHPNQRLGQLLINAVGNDDLWNVYDETWIDLWGGE